MNEMSRAHAPSETDSSSKKIFRKPAKSSLRIESAASNQYVLGGWGKARREIKVNFKIKILVQFS